jgi:hypothetical protein
MFQDRRLYQRLTPSSPQLVLLDESKYSLLFDLCEGGLAVEGFTADKSLDVFSLEIELPEGNGCIQAKAEIVWTSDSGYRTGFRFVELADSYRQQLKVWISSDSAAEGVSFISESAPPSLLQEIPLQDLPAAEERPAEEFRPSSTLFPILRPAKFGPAGTENPEYNPFTEQRTSRFPSTIVLALVMAFIAFLMGYYWRGSQVRRNRQAQTAAAAAAKEVAPNPTATPNPPAQPSTTGPPSLDQSGFVVQVGAMEKESNADALSASLHQKKFSAFVFKRGADHLYRVVVGPFPNEQSALTIERDLQAQGFKALLRPWSPE